MSPMSNLE